MTHAFDTALAKRFGVEETILLNSIEFWVAVNSDNPDAQHEGRTWMYNSAKAWTILHPYWTHKQIRRILASLVDHKLIVTKQFGGMDRSAWFTLSRGYRVMFPNRSIDVSKKRSPRSQSASSTCPNGNMTYRSDTNQISEANHPSVNPYPLPPSLGSEAMLQAWLDWQQHRKERKPFITPTTAAAQIKKLVAMGEKRAIAALNFSIEGGYMGIFEPKPDLGTALAQPQTQSFGFD